jgi:hypothetical protein
MENRNWFSYISVFPNTNYQSLEKKPRNAQEPCAPLERRPTPEAQPPCRSRPLSLSTSAKLVRTRVICSRAGPWKHSTEAQNPNFDDNVAPFDGGRNGMRGSSG